MLSTPNGTHVTSLLKFMTRRELGPSLYKASEVYERLGHFAHLREYSLNEIRTYLQKFGFRVVERRYRAFWTTSRVAPLLDLAAVAVPTIADNIFVVAEA